MYIISWHWCHSWLISMNLSSLPNCERCYFWLHFFIRRFRWYFGECKPVWCCSNAKFHSFFIQNIILTGNAIQTLKSNATKLLNFRQKNSFQMKLSWKAVFILGIIAPQIRSHKIEVFEKWQENWTKSLQWVEATIFTKISFPSDIRELVSSLTFWPW